MLKIGVLGAGHLGKIHLNILKDLPDFELVGFYDPDEQKSLEAVEKFGIKRYSSENELIAAVDVVDIVTPTLDHMKCAESAIKQSRHVFIEKPLANTVEEAKEIILLAEEADIKVQVGHVERFNPAFTAARPYFNNPMFIETHRLAQFNPRGTDVSVVLDLMIHDIDIVLSVVNGVAKKISASGVAVVSDTPDIANARIEFDNGCVANLTASRISLKNMRKSRFFQRDAYISVDFLDKKTELVKIKDVEGDADPLAMIIDLPEGRSKQIYFEKPVVTANNAIRDELTEFAKAINEDTDTAVTARDGYEALLIAHEIVDKLKVTSAMAI